MTNGNESIPSMVLRHEQDLYRGNGKPGLTTRIKSLEDCTDIMENSIKIVDKRVDRVQAMFWAIILLLVSILAGVVVDIFKPHDQGPIAHNIHTSSND